MKRKPGIKRAVVSVKGMQSVFRLGKRILGEERKKFEVNLFQLDSSMQKTGKVASGNLMVFSAHGSAKRARGPITRIMKEKDVALINYQILEEYHAKEFLGRGIGKQLIRSLEELARERRIGIIAGAVRKDNLFSASILFSSGYRKLKGTELYYKIL